MDKVEFDPIDRLQDPQRFVSATFDKRYVTFAKLQKLIDFPRVVARTESIQGLLKWVDDKSAVKVFGFAFKADSVANVFWAFLTDRWVLLHLVDKSKVVHHEFLSIESLRKLVNEMQFRAKS